MINFLYFGRLESEKGVGLIIDTFSSLYERGITDRHLDIYGTGLYDATCVEFAKRYSNNVTYYGRAAQQTIFAKLKEIDVALMPSFVIETFGLTALEALAQGVPVIGFQKGGTAPFIFDDLNISAYEGKSDVGKLTALVTGLINKGFSKETYHTQIENIVDQFSQEKRLANFKAISGDAKRILMASDFISQIGGIESYLHNTKKLLEAEGYAVELFGSNSKNSFGGLFKTVLNIGARRKLRQRIQEFQPDLIWCHSLIRNLGWLPLTAIPRDTHTLIMFHDMGYFHPYPARLFSLGQLPQTTGMFSWIQSAHLSAPIKWGLLALKWLSLVVIRMMLRSKNTTYLVPSEYMQPIAKKRLGEENEVALLPHSVK